MIESYNWTAYNAAQSEEKTRFVALLADLCSGIPQPERAPGAGRPRLPLSDMIFASVFKVYVGFSSISTLLNMQRQADEAHAEAEAAAVDVDDDVAMTVDEGHGRRHGRQRCSNACGYVERAASKLTAR